MNNSDIFDFLINEEDEVMLLLYAREGEPDEDGATAEISFGEKAILLHRAAGDDLLLDDVPDSVLDALQDADVLMVCELARPADEGKYDDADIVYAYEAEIRD